MPRNDASTRVQALNDRYRHHSATDVMRHALTDAQIGRLALVSSFGAESVVLLHMLSVTRRDTPVIFIDTRLLFTETLVYQQELAERLDLADLRIYQVRHLDLAASDRDGTLHKRDPDACCNLRKTKVLSAALDGFDGWITGRKRFQGGNRETLDFFEIEAGTGRIKVNPLAHWAPDDVRDYIEENRLPRHPMVARGYPSIGCMPCTSRVAQGEDMRAGRWRGTKKSECGIHFADGKLVRKGENV